MYLPVTSILKQGVNSSGGGYVPSNLEIARLDSFSIICLGTPGCILEHFSYFVIQCLVEIRRDIMVVERFFHGRFDEQVCHT